MGSIDVTDIKPGTKLLIEGQPYVVIERQFVKPGKGTAFTRTKMKNLLTGRNIENNIRSGEKLETADVEEKAMSFLYKEGDDFVFMDQQNYEQINVLKEAVADQWQWLKDNMVCSIQFFNGKVIGIALPNFVEMRITHSEPGVKGDTSGNVTKPATIETGAVVAVPLFVNEGDMIRIDTRSGEYCERVLGK
jgi:elongation factor P